MDTQRIKILGNVYRRKNVVPIFFSLVFCFSPFVFRAPAMLLSTSPHSFLSFFLLFSRSETRRETSSWPKAGKNWSVAYGHGNRCNPVRFHCWYIFNTRTCPTCHISRAGLSLSSVCNIRQPLAQSRVQVDIHTVTSFQLRKRKEEKKKGHHYPC